MHPEVIEGKKAGKTPLQVGLEDSVLGQNFAVLTVVWRKGY